MTTHQTQIDRLYELLNKTIPSRLELKFGCNAVDLAIKMLKEYKKLQNNK